MRSDDPAPPRSTPWVRPLSGPPRPAGTLVCFPHAGGPPGYFRSWAGPLGDDVALAAVRYPGWHDAAGSVTDPRPNTVTTVTGVAAGVAGDLEGRPSGPLALFGHSMGAVVAYETARELARRGAAGDVSLVVSGSVPPWLRAPSAVHREDDDGLVAELRRLGGTEDALVTDLEQRAAWLPAIRADFRLIETHEHRPGEPLRCPVTAVLGDRDTEAPVADARAWRAATHGRFRLRTLPGGHFYLAPKRDALLGQLRRWLLPAERTAPAVALP